MMAAVREWLTAVVTVTMLLSVVQVLVPEGHQRRIASFLGGLILLVTLLRPLIGMDLRRLDLRLETYEREIAERQEALAAAGKEEMASIIELRTAAYISDKADALGLTVTAEVQTEAGPEGIPVPYRAELTGAWSEELASYMEGELGIPRERQVWHEEEH